MPSSNHPYLEAQKVLDLIEAAKDHFFSVTFDKRTTGERRTMLARRGVSKGVVGTLAPGVRQAEDLRTGVVTVFDIQKDSFRRIPLDSVVEVRVEGQTVTS